jgi:hypothetical protein
MKERRAIDFIERICKNMTYLSLLCLLSNLTAATPSPHIQNPIRHNVTFMNGGAMRSSLRTTALLFCRNFLFVFCFCLWIYGFWRRRDYEFGFSESLCLGLVWSCLLLFQIWLGSVSVVMVFRRRLQWYWLVPPSAVHYFWWFY